MQFPVSETTELPSSSVPLKDDIECLEELSKGPPAIDDVPRRLLFLHQILVEECHLNRNLAIETWLQVIEGTDGHDDLWSWEDGDEEWLRLNFNHSYDSTDIHPGDWEQARRALQTRLSRASRHIVNGYTQRTRIFMIGWRTLVSSYVMNIRKKRGLVPYRDPGLDVNAWYTCVHRRFEFPDINHIELRKTFFPSLRGDVHQCTTDMSMIKDWIATVSKLYTRDNLVDVCKVMCRCDACATRIGQLASPQSDYPSPEFLTIDLVPPLSVDVSMEDINECPPMSLVISWLLYYHLRLKDFEYVEPTITPLLFFLETAIVDDILDLWYLTESQEACIRKHLIVGPPEASYVRWINDYPESWRRPISRLSTGDWRRLDDALTMRLSSIRLLGFTSRRRPLSFPEDGFVWFGSLLWVMVEEFDGQTYSSPQHWFDVWDDEEDPSESLRLPPVNPTAISVDFAKSVIDSGHTCYSDYTDYLHWYAVMFSWSQTTDKVDVISWESADPVEQRECPACIQIEAYDEPIEQMRPSVDLLMLCDLLSTWCPSVNPWTDPSGWVASNLHNLRWVLRQATNLTQCEIPVELLMFPRLTIYVWGHLRSCGSDPMICRALRQTLDDCRTWTGIEGFIKHQNLGRDLLKLLRKCRYYDGPYCRLPRQVGCDDEDCEQLQRIEYLDMLNVYAHFATALEDCQTYKALLACRGPIAQSLLNSTQQLLDVPRLDERMKHKLLLLLVKLSRASDLHPESLIVRGIQKHGQHLVAGGSFGDVWMGMMRGDTVAIKVMRILDDPDEKFLKKFFREAVIWRQLSHPNILPFHGLHHFNGGMLRIALISPWMENGNIVNYLKSHPDANRSLLIQDIASGLKYLHSLEVIHGDLKGLNIFITSSYRACLADLGLSIIKDSQGASSSTTIGGTPRFLAPELLRTDVDHVENTLESDIYAFACVCYEVFTGQLPFHETIRDLVVYANVLAGQRPGKPSPDYCWWCGLTDHVWDLMQSCWDVDPSSRPTAAKIVASFGWMLASIKDTRPRPSSYNRPSDDPLALDYAHLMKRYCWDSVRIPKAIYARG